MILPLNHQEQLSGNNNYKINNKFLGKIMKLCSLLLVVLLND